MINGNKEGEGEEEESKQGINEERTWKLLITTALILSGRGKIYKERDYDLVLRRARVPGQSWAYLSLDGNSKFR